MSDVLHNAMVATAPEGGCIFGMWRYAETGAVSLGFVCFLLKVSVSGLLGVGRRKCYTAVCCFRLLKCHLRCRACGSAIRDWDFSRFLCIIAAQDYTPRPEANRLRPFCKKLNPKPLNPKPLNPKPLNH